jgi:hypothetical protein
MKRDLCHRRISMRAAIRGGLFNYLMRSTEIRLALLALVGVTRAITYLSQSTAQSAVGVAAGWVSGLEALRRLAAHNMLSTSPTMLGNSHGSLTSICGGEMTFSFLSFSREA